MKPCWLQYVLLLACLLSGNCANLRVQQPFRSKKSPSETINVFETVNPVVVFDDDQTMSQGYHRRALVILHLEQDTYTLKLELNEFLLSPGFVSGYHIDGVKVEEKHDNCFYHGTVTGHPQWRVALSTCYGLRGWFGDLNDPSTVYHIEPIEDTTSITEPHAVYSDSQHQNNKLGTCGTGKPHDIHTVPDPVPSDILDSMPHQHWLKKRQSGQTLIVEWLLVNDYYQFINYNRNISAVALRAIEIANQVDLLYKPLNVRVVLVHSLTWTTQQEIAETQDSDMVLDLFQVYHRNNADFRDIAHDSAMLITGIEINGPTVGVAFLNRMCVYDDSVGFTMDGQGSVLGVGSIAAHELGHIFNMQHDDSEGCQCPDGVSACIMAATLSFPPPQMFSQCSKNQLEEGLEVFGRGVCLQNNPTVIFGDPACGNGIKEPGEVCDCGSVNECNDPCCNATSCTLSEGSQCAEGPCCDKCQFKSYGTSCRESRGVCGIEEYCAGDSAECPRDVYLQNGSPCESNTAFCYDGLCASLSSQCNIYYGEESEPSHEECYNQLNIQGEGYGHCGFSNGAFVPCNQQNAICGSIQCSGGEINFDNIQFSGTLTYYTRSAQAQGTFYQCKTFSTGASSDEISPGLVLEGTKCGNESLCISQQCVGVSSLGLTPCPEGSNGEVCSGNGVCNNLDQCSCNIGYTGSDCNERVGASSKSGANPGVVAASVVIALVVLVALIVAIVIVTLVIIMKMKKNKTFSPSRKPRSYPSKSTSDSRTKPGAHGSTDDLLMTGISPRGGSSPVPPSAPSVSYRPYIPPTYTAAPTVTVSQRPAPPSNQPKPRPPPPSRTPPTVNKPGPGVSRPPPPAAKKPLPAPVNNKPGTAPKPGNKVAGIWPPPAQQESSNKPAPMKPPIVPRKQ